jgi:hypothetical protein
VVYVAGDKYASIIVVGDKGTGIIHRRREVDRTTSGHFIWHTMMVHGDASREMVVPVRGTICRRWLQNRLWWRRWRRGEGCLQRRKYGSFRGG